MQDDHETVRIAAIAFHAVPRDCRYGAGNVDFSDSLVPRVGDENIADPVRKNSDRRIQLGIHGGPAIA